MRREGRHVEEAQTQHRREEGATTWNTQTYTNSLNVFWNYANSKVLNIEQIPKFVFLGGGGGCEDDSLLLSMYAMVQSY